MTIYCVGLTKNYEQYFREQNPPYKKGRTDDYEGGSVWKTYSEADKNCPPGFSVYGILADWDKDVEGGFLLFDRALVQVSQT